MSESALEQPGGLHGDRAIGQVHLPSEAELADLFQQKYGQSAELGWSPRQRFRSGYYLPADVYEAVVKALVFNGCTWIDVGGGRTIFPENAALARTLVSRCRLVVGVDPSDNINENSFVHQRFQSFIEDYHTDRVFDLATLRMVAEHVTEPKRMIQSLHRLLRPGGLAVVLTVNRWSPITLLSQVTPFGLHHPLKQLFWGGEEKDTFPVQYKMNTRSVLSGLFEREGFQEAAFAYLDDLSLFGNFVRLSAAELFVWRLLRRMGLRYPETCLLGVYRKQPVEKRSAPN